MTLLKYEGMLLCLNNPDLEYAVWYFRFSKSTQDEYPELYTASLVSSHALPFLSVTQQVKDTRHRHILTLDLTLESPVGNEMCCLPFYAHLPPSSCRHDLWQPSASKCFNKGINKYAIGCLSIFCWSSPWCIIAALLQLSWRPQELFHWIGFMLRPMHRSFSPIQLSQGKLVHGQLSQLLEKSQTLPRTCMLLYPALLRYCGLLWNHKNMKSDSLC